LSRLRSHEVLVTLRLALADQSSSVRIQAMRGIKNLKGTEAIGDLHAIVVSDPDPMVRRQAVRLLSEMESAEVLGLLYGAVADRDAAVSREASEAIRKWEQRFGVRDWAAGWTR
jgi:HEAT repeat protein